MNHSETKGHSFPVRIKRKNKREVSCTIQEVGFCSGTFCASQVGEHYGKTLQHLENAFRNRGQKLRRKCSETVADNNNRLTLRCRYFSCYSNTWSRSRWCSSSSSVAAGPADPLWARLAIDVESIADVVRRPKSRQRTHPI